MHSVSCRLHNKCWPTAHCSQLGNPWMKSYGTDIQTFKILISDAAQFCFFPLKCYKSVVFLGLIAVLATGNADHHYPFNHLYYFVTVARWGIAVCQGGRCYCSMEPKELSQEHRVSAQSTGTHNGSIMIILLSLSLLTTVQDLHTFLHTPADMSLCMNVSTHTDLFLTVAGLVQVKSWLHTSTNWSKPVTGCGI